MSVSAVARVMGVSYAAVYGWVKKAREAMGIMEMERERRNLSAVDIPHSVKAMRGIDCERTEAKALSFNETRRRVRVRKGESCRSARVWTAMAEEADGGARFDFVVNRRVFVRHRFLRHSRPNARDYGFAARFDGKRLARLRDVYEQVTKRPLRAGVEMRLRVFKQNQRAFGGGVSLRDYRQHLGRARAGVFRIFDM